MSFLVVNISSELSSYSFISVLFWYNTYIVFTLLTILSVQYKSVKYFTLLCKEYQEIFTLQN